MRIIGCDLHARQQTLAMLDTTTGEVANITLLHEGDGVREFYSKLPHPVRVGIEATGSMQWFLNLTGELRIECVVGHPAQVRAAEPRKQKHDRRDADLILKLLVENRFPAIWMPSAGIARSASSASAPASMGAHADAHSECFASDGSREWITTWKLSVEPGRSECDRVLATHASFGLSPNRSAGDVREDRRGGRGVEPPGRRAS